MNPGSGSRLLSILLLLGLVSIADRGASAVPSEHSIHGVWEQVVESAPPSTPIGSFTAHDAAQDRFILLTPGLEVWSLALGPGHTWQRLQATGEVPDVRDGYSVVHDAEGVRLLVFGGRSAIGQPGNRVWVLDLDGAPHWTRLQPAGTPPAPRFEHGAIYDPGRREMVVFGGQDLLAREIWALELKGPPRWTVRTVTGPTPPIGVTRAVHDPRTDRAIATIDDVVFLRVWALTLGETPAWTNLDPAGAGPAGPPWRTLSLDDARRRLLILAPQGISLAWSTLWEFSLEGTGAWRIADQYSLPLRGGFNHSMALETSADRLLVWVGYSAEAWSYQLEPRRWDQLTGAPRGRTGHSLVHDPPRRRMLLTTGYEGAAHPNGPAEYDTRVWALSLEGTPRWSITEHTWPRLEDGAALFDPLHDRLLGIGGMELVYPGCSSVYDAYVPQYGRAAWSIPLGGGSPGVLPEPHFPAQGHRALLDPKGRRVFVFGRALASAVCDHNARLTWSFGNELRILSLTDPVGWSEVAIPASGPTPRAWHAAAYDEDRGGMWFWGGGGAPTGNYGELWRLDPADPSSWTLVQPEGESPPAISRHAMIYDPVRERLVSFGNLDEVWALSLVDEPRWERLTPTGVGPGRRNAYAAAYDPANDQVVLFGGIDGGKSVWTLHWGDPLLRVSLDVRPGDARNTIQPAGGGVLAIAILGSTTFDARSVDLETVVLSGASPLRAADGTVASSTGDVNRDGSLDLTIRVRVEDLVLDESAPRVRLDGRAKDGTRIRAFDDLRLAPGRELRLAAERGDASILAVRFDGAHPATSRARGALRVTLPSSEPAHLEVFSVAGRRIHESTVSPGTRRIDLGALGSLVPGVYTVRLRQSGASASTRWVVLD